MKTKDIIVNKLMAYRRLPTRSLIVFIAAWLASPLFFHDWKEVTYGGADFAVVAIAIFFYLAYTRYWVNGDKIMSSEGLLFEGKHIWTSGHVYTSGHSNFYRAEINHLSLFWALCSPSSFKTILLGGGGNGIDRMIKREEIIALIDEEAYNLVKHDPIDTRPNPITVACFSMTVEIVQGEGLSISGNLFWLIKDHIQRRAERRCLI